MHPPRRPQAAGVDPCAAAGCATAARPVFRNTAAPRPAPAPRSAAPFARRCVASGRTAGVPPASSSPAAATPMGRCGRRRPGRADTPPWPIADCKSLKWSGNCRLVSAVTGRCSRRCNVPPNAALEQKRPGVEQINGYLEQKRRQLERKSHNLGHAWNGPSPSLDSRRTAHAVELPATMESRRKRRRTQQQSRAGACLVGPPASSGGSKDPPRRHLHLQPTPP